VAVKKKRVMMKKMSLTGSHASTSVRPQALKPPNSSTPFSMPAFSRRRRRLLLLHVTMRVVVVAATRRKMARKLMPALLGAKNGEKSADDNFNKKHQHQ
jgi:hypothetical protein